MAAGELDGSGGAAAIDDHMLDLDVTRSVAASGVDAFPRCSTAFSVGGTMVTIME